MPQQLLPIYNDEGQEGYITDILSYGKKDGSIYYFLGAYPIYSHPIEDLKSFRLITSQFVVNGRCKQIDLVKAFGVSPISIKRYVKKYRENGAEAFFTPKRSRGAHVLTPKVLEQAQDLLNQGSTPSEVADRLNVIKNTLKKAIRSGRLLEPVKKNQKKEAARVKGA
ncbi:MAG: hypothetical protein GY774_10830 [Planctomycetes bacterium]|nr:hypothetical protein [Planctomycetota bacterium]